MSREWLALFCGEGLYTYTRVRVPHVPAVPPHALHTIIRLICYTYTRIQLCSTGLSLFCALFSRLGSRSNGEVGFRVAGLDDSSMNELAQCVSLRGSRALLSLSCLTTRFAHTQQLDSTTTYTTIFEIRDRAPRAHVHISRPRAARALETRRVFCFVFEIFDSLSIRNRERVIESE